MSAIKMMNIDGLKIAPWGEPTFVVSTSDIVDPIITDCLLSVRYVSNHDLLLMSKPYCSNFEQKIFFDKVSNAALKSKHVTIETFLAMYFLSHVSCIETIAEKAF